MIKNLLLFGAAAVSALSVCAETKVYTMDELGDEVNVSPNGKFVSVGDFEQSLSYLWNIEAPETFLPLPGEKVVAYDVDNNGTVVGSIYQRGGIWRPCVLEDGEWTVLPCHAAVINEAEATCISADGTIIAGTQFISDKTSEIAGRYYPCIWKKGDDGKWTLTAYTGIKLPDHQGFLTKALYVDGENVIIGGRLYCGIGSEIPAMIVNGELKYWNKLDSEKVPFMFKGQYVAYDSEGKQYKTDDPNDPNIFYYDEYKIDGYKDGETGEYFTGELTSVDSKGYFYGYRTRAENVDADGNGKLRNGALVYDYKNDEFVDNTAYSAFMTGIGGGKVIFPIGNKIIVDGTAKSLTETYGFTPDKTLTGVKNISDDGKVLGAVTEVVNPGTGEKQYFPLVVVLDEPLVAGIDGIVSENGVSIIVSAGRIDVAGAHDVTVYDMNGRVVSNAATSHVAAGIYIVKAGDVTRKVMVK